MDLVRLGNKLEVYLQNIVTLYLPYEMPMVETLSPDVRETFLGTEWTIFPSFLIHSEQKLLSRTFSKLQSDYVAIDQQIGKLP